MGTAFMVAIFVYVCAILFKSHKVINDGMEGIFVGELAVLFLALALEFVVIVPKIGW